MHLPWTLWREVSKFDPPFGSKFSIIKPSLVIYVWRAFLNSKSYKVIKMYNLNWTCLKTLVRIIALAPKFWDLKSIGSGAWTERFAYEHLDHRPPYSPSKTKVAREVARLKAVLSCHAPPGHKACYLPRLQKPREAQYVEELHMKFLVSQK